MKESSVALYAPPSPSWKVRTRAGYAIVREKVTLREWEPVEAWTETG